MTFFLNSISIGKSGCIISLIQTLTRQFTCKNNFIEVYVHISGISVHGCKLREPVDLFVLITSVCVSMTSSCQEPRDPTLVHSSFFICFCF